MTEKNNQSKPKRYYYKTMIDYLFTGDKYIYGRFIDEDSYTFMSSFEKNGFYTEHSKYTYVQMPIFEVYEYVYIPIVEDSIKK